MRSKVHPEKPYTITAKQQSRLAAALVLAPKAPEEAALLLGRMTKAELTDAFVQFLRLAASVEANARDTHEFYFIVDQDVHPHSVEQMNLPTLLGALKGATQCVQKETKGMCGGCAFRLGSIANQCLSTQVDTEFVAQERDRFMCHERMDESTGEPTHICAGFVLFSAAKGAAHVRS